MSFIKKNLTFSLIVLVCVLAFLAGAYLIFVESGKVSQAERRLSSAEARLNALLDADPAPTAENVATAEENVAQLSAALASIKEDLQRGSGLNTSADGVGVMAGIQQYISDFQRKAGDATNSKGESEPIAIPADFAFGFDRYIDEAVMLDDAEIVPRLDKQRQILSYIVEQLIASAPKSIDSVAREVIEDPDADGFAIDDAVSARAPGAIDTMAFSLSFSGYTETLRQLLNKLARFDLPIVVRSIAVARPSGSETVAAPKSQATFDDIFGIFGEQSGAPEQPAAAQKPVIEENISKFTVIVEFIEVVLPEAAAEEIY
ncbi:MAG: hypothetical protein ACPG3X_06800 [Opitutales bacterium]